MPEPVPRPTPADPAPPHPHELMETVAAACATVAYADGWVTPEERRRLLAAIRASDALRVFPADDVLRHFDAAIARFEREGEAAERLALEQVAGLAGLRREARQLVAACYAVAAADLQIDGEERALVLHVCGLLDIDPAELDLVAES